MSKNKKNIQSFYTDFLGKNTSESVKKDEYGNPLGSEFDLALDGAFKNMTIAVLHLYTGGGFDFNLPEKALKEKGFSIVRWVNNPPNIKDFIKVLSNSSQLWIISDSSKKLTDKHLVVIKDFFERGHGLFIWGDNIPYYKDANYISESLLNTTMHGNTNGQKVVSLQVNENKAGIINNHAITTGIEYLYEGHTVATIIPSKDMNPLMYGSANNLITAYYEKDGKRAIIDGGYTKLYINWDTAGTGRYVKNAATWLCNVEKFFSFDSNFMDEYSVISIKESKKNKPKNNFEDDSWDTIEKVNSSNPNDDFENNNIWEKL